MKRYRIRIYSWFDVPPLPNGEPGPAHNGIGRLIVRGEATHAIWTYALEEFVRKLDRHQEVEMKEATTLTIELSVLPHLDVPVRSGESK